MVPLESYSMDDVSRIAEMKDRATFEAREHLPELRRHLFQRPAEPFEHYHVLAFTTADSSNYHSIKAMGGSFSDTAEGLG